MDGILCNFTAAAIKFHGGMIDPLDIRWNFLMQIGFTSIDDPAFWDPLGHEFARDLAIHEDGMVVFRAAEKLVGPGNIALLTNPWDTPGCYDGKKAWVTKHLPEYRKRFFTGASKGMVVDHPGKVLIDDYEANITSVHKAGGQAIMPPRPWNHRRNECLPCGSFDPDVIIAELEALL